MTSYEGRRARKVQKVRAGAENAKRREIATLSLFGDSGQSIGHGSQRGQPWASLPNGPASARLPLPAAAAKKPPGLIAIGSAVDIPRPHTNPQCSIVWPESDGTLSHTRASEMGVYTEPALTRCSRRANVPRLCRQHAELIGKYGKVNSDRWSGARFEPRQPQDRLGVSALAARHWWTPNATMTRAGHVNQGQRDAHRGAGRQRRFRLHVHLARENGRGRGGDPLRQGKARPQAGHHDRRHQPKQDPLQPLDGRSEAAERVRRRHDHHR